MNPPRYGRERIRRGAVHFLLGKGISSVAGFAVLLLLVRELPVAEFAAYSVLQAFVEVFTALTGFGLTHAALRYVPELYARHENKVFRGFVVGTSGLRLLFLTLACLLAYAAGDALARLFGLAAWVGVFQAYLAVVWVRVNGQFMFQLLESTLHQGLGQAAFVMSTLCKLALIAWLAFNGSLNIERVIWSEVTAEAMGLGLLIISVWRVLRETNPEPSMQGLAEWWAGNSRRVTRYGFAGYLQHLAILPYGSAPNRLVAGRFLEVYALAAFGFAQSFADMLRRYLPAQLLSGLIRPVLVARYAATKDFGAVVAMLALVFRVNSVLLGLPSAVLLAVGPAAVRALSNEKYGADAAWLLLALVGVLVLESRRFLIDLAIQAVERNGLLVVGNLALAASMLLAVLLIPKMGALAIPLAAGLGLAVSNAWITHRLAKEGFVFTFGYLDFTRILLSVLLASLTGIAVQRVLGWALGLAIIFVSYPLLLWITGAIRREDWQRLRHFRQPSNELRNVRVP